MNFGHPISRRLIAFAMCCLVIGSVSGCSSLGLSGWPTQFHLLAKTKQFAAAAPLPAGLPHELGKLEVQNYFVEPGDRVLIEPVNLDSEIGSLGDQKIQVDGSVDLGKFGRIRVAGMSVEEIEKAVEDQLETYGAREQINVQLVESNAAQIYVLGEVGSPAAYPIEGHEHVLDAILSAGGLTSKASPCDIVLVRPTLPDRCRVVLPVCYRQITQLGDVTTNYQLQPGDRIIVGSRGFCEELAFWNQGKECSRCSRSCCVECQPSTVNYQNRFAGRQMPFSKTGLQTERQSSQESGQSKRVDGSGKPVGGSDFLLREPNRSNLKSDAEPKPASKSDLNPVVKPDFKSDQKPDSNSDAKSDEDLFLPPVKSDGAGK